MIEPPIALTATPVMIKPMGKSTILATNNPTTTMTTINCSDWLSKWTVPLTLGFSFGLTT